MPGLHFNSKLHGYKPAYVIDSEPESTSCSPAVYKRRGMFSPFEWLTELLTTTISLLLFGGIVAICWKMDNKPLKNMSEKFLSPNTILSLLSTTCSAALMHGVSNFISQVKWLHFKNGHHKLADLKRFDEASRGPWGALMFFARGNFNLATIGAVVTIARFGFSPMIQQLVDIRVQLVPEGNAVFRYTHSYDRGISLANSGTASIPQDRGLQVAIFRGLYNISSPEEVNCPGQCWWKGRYISLGFATKCTNVTQATLGTQLCDKAYDNPSSNVCNMTTPGGLNLSTEYVPTDSTTTYQMSVSAMDPPELPEIARFALYLSTADADFNALDINITDCSLSLTAYEYTKAQSNGSSFGFVESRQVDPGPWKSNGTVYHTNESKAEGLPALNISMYDLAALQNYLRSDNIVGAWVTGNWPKKNSGLSAAFSGYVDIGKRFEMLAYLMTEYIRSGPNSMTAVGDNYNYEAFISIRWKYLIGPGVFELTALLFAVMTILRNRRSRNVPLWKSSELAVLACQYDGESRKLRANVMDLEEIEKTAEVTFAQLE